MADGPTPSPDEILARIKRDEAKSARGKLKIFFGMCPGVGKTFAMLQAARQAQKDGREVVIGIVETHGRAETEALLEGLAIVPRAQRGRAYGLYYVVFGVAWFAGSVMLGWLYDHDRTACGTVAAVALGLGACAVMWSGRRVKST